MPEPAILAWTAWYTGGRLYRSSEVSCSDLPDDGCLGLVLCEATLAPSGYHTRQLLSGYDWYFCIPDTDLWGANNDPPEETRRRYPGAVLKRGQWTTATEMARVNEAMAAEHFGDDPPLSPSPCGGC